MNADLTDADREYCRRWCESRGKRPYLTKLPEAQCLPWSWWEDWNSAVGYHEHRLPSLLYSIIGRRNFPTEQAALDALALALKACRAAAAIPADKITGHGPETDPATRDASRKGVSTDVLLYYSFRCLY